MAGERHVGSFGWVLRTPLVPWLMIVLPSVWIVAWVIVLKLSLLLSKHCSRFAQGIFLRPSTNSDTP